MPLFEGHKKSQKSQLPHSAFHLLHLTVVLQLYTPSLNERIGIDKTTVDQPVDFSYRDLGTAIHEVHEKSTAWCVQSGQPSSPGLMAWHGHGSILTDQ